MPLTAKILNARELAKSVPLTSEPNYIETPAQKPEPSSEPPEPSPVLRKRAILDIRDALDKAIHIARPFLVPAGWSAMVPSALTFWKLVASSKELRTALAVASRAAIESGLRDSHADLISGVQAASENINAAIAAKDVSGYLTLMLELKNALPSSLQEVKQAKFSPAVEVIESPSTEFLSAARLMKAVALAQQDVQRFKPGRKNVWLPAPRQKLPASLRESSRKLVGHLLAAEKAFKSSRPGLAERLRDASSMENASSLRLLGDGDDLKAYATSLDELAAHIEKELQLTIDVSG